MTNMNTNKESNEIQVVVETDEVEKGHHYKGNVQFNNTSFSYEIGFAFDFGSLDELMQENVQQAREGITIRATDSKGRPVRIDDVARMCLFSAIYEGVKHHYQHPHSKRKGLVTILEDAGFVSIQPGPTRIKTVYPALPQFQEFLARYGEPHE